MAPVSPRRIRRTALALSAVVVSALALSACAGSSADTPSTGSSDAAAGFGDLTVQLSWIKNEEFAGEYFADQNGYFTDGGFDSVNLVAGPSTGIPELLSGTADVSISNAVAVGAAVANEGAPVKIIGTTLQKNPFTVLSLKDGGDIATPEDLVGKKIGVQDSNLSLFNAFLAANDIDASALEIVPVQYDPAPLVNGEVDGFVAYLTNEAITVEQSGVATTNLPFADNGLPFVAETFTVTDEVLESRRDELKAFLVAEIKGWQDALADPDEGARLAIEEYGADLDLDPEKTLAGMLATNALIETSETDANGLFTISDDLQTQTVASLAGAGITLEASDLFDLSLLAEVYEENPDLR
ncbi:ABC transporter substrate-binding protein [Microbacterium sp. cx-59]|uniref:ABC transporter substrate-binding protein n=1 Tax=Microbacterium sp. cx-59 TaxID=2891207 RepID=UPI001E59F4B0|nr:ABC transporter substrate-binding protein [Microbacterium sp. cx-59]MCC4908575.1 ABC transporter substrate-binding protein [Microbacterium sp. cx-59]